MGIHIARQHTIFGAVNNLTKVAVLILFLNLLSASHMLDDSIGIDNNCLVVADGYVGTLFHSFVELVAITYSNQLPDVLQKESHLFLPVKSILQLF